MTTSSKESTSSKTKEDDKPQGTISGDAKLDERFKFGPPPIQTSEDATMAYLREEITEDEYRTALGKFGTLPGQVFKAAKGAERVDTAFKNSIPDDIYDEMPNPQDSLDIRVEAVNKAQDEREEAIQKAISDQPLKVTEVPVPLVPVSEKNPPEPTDVTPSKTSSSDTSSSGTGR